MRQVLIRWKEEFLDAFALVEDQSRQWVEDNRRRIDWRLVGLVILSCFILTFLEYYGGSGDYRILEAPLGWFFDDAAERMRYTFRESDYARLFRLMYWSGSTFVGYMLVPMLYVKFVMRDTWRNFGLGARGALRHSWIYLVLLIAVLPAVYFVSFDDSFQDTYPFYDQASRSWMDFLLWEFTYALQFLSLEFFYRGFLVHGLKKRFGVYAVLLSVVPYCMIHFGKPMPETLGAVFAGIALGILSLFTRSIWLGVAIHVSVAVAMDILSLWNQGKLTLF